MPSPISAATEARAPGPESLAGSSGSRAAIGVERHRRAAAVLGQHLGDGREGAFRHGVRRQLEDLDLAGVQLVAELQRGLGHHDGHAGHRRRRRGLGDAWRWAAWSWRPRGRRDRTGRRPRD